MPVQLFNQKDNVEVNNINQNKRPYPICASNRRTKGKFLSFSAVFDIETSSTELLRKEHFLSAAIEATVASERDSVSTNSVGSVEFEEGCGEASPCIEGGRESCWF